MYSCSDIGLVHQSSSEILKKKNLFVLFWSFFHLTDHRAKTKRRAPPPPQSGTAEYNPLCALLSPNARLYCQAEPWLDQSALLISPVPTSFVVNPSYQHHKLPWSIHCSFPALTHEHTSAKPYSWRDVCLYICHWWRFMYTVQVALLLWAHGVFPLP